MIKPVIKKIIDIVHFLCPPCALHWVWRHGWTVNNIFKFLLGHDRQALFVRRNNQATLNLTSFGKLHQMICTPLGFIKRVKR